MNLVLTEKDLAILDAFEKEDNPKGVAKDDGYLRCSYIGEPIVSFEMVEKAGMRRRKEIITRVAPINSDVLVIGAKGQSYFSMPDDTWYFRKASNRYKGANIIGFNVESEWLAVDEDDLKFDGEK